MRTIKIAITSALFLSLFSNCSKKVVLSNNNEEQYKLYSHELEADYAKHESTLTASINNDEIIVPLETKNFVSERISTSKNTYEGLKKVEMKMVPQLVSKHITRRIENMVHKQEAKKQNADSGSIIGGIILGVLGLILIGIAGATSAAALVWVGGVVLFVAGVILLLVGIF